MRISHSQYCFPSQLRASDRWFEERGKNSPPFFRLKDLFGRVLKQVSAQEPGSEENNRKNGKKRAAPSIFVDNAKKRRLSPGITPSTTTEKHGTIFPLFPFPPVPISYPGRESLPIWSHTFSIRYANDSDGLLCGDLPDTLNTLCGSLSESATIDIGYTRVLDFQKRMIASWNPKFSYFGGDDYLVLPFSNDDQGDTAILQSCYELELAGKVSICAHMKVVFFPGSFHDVTQKQLPFEIQLEVTVSFLLPALFAPLPRKETKKRARFIEECQSHLYHFLYGHSSEQTANIPHNIDIPYFYSILTPAPPVPSRLANNALQPEALLPNLLPFQRRSVAWLLGHEGKEVTTEGKIVPKPDDGGYDFWDEVQEGNHTFFYNRLSRMLSYAKPVMEEALGGILAEEPGLGKTLETLALILLNPAPEDRGPSVIRWDPEARLNVKAVKTTLIVTPNALAAQWADEISTHAPSLKVLVYDGWAKVTVPILNTFEERERVRKLLKQKKVNSKTKTKKPPLKGAVGKGKGKEKEKVDDSAKIIESVEMDVDEEDSILDWCKYVQQYDIVITTYAILRTDFNVARASIERPRREDVSYTNVERPRSPLVMVEWMRVVMDEVQMVGGGKAEDMVSLIPRLASFAVSGTPARSQVSDLSHALKFLRVQNRIGSPGMWAQLLRPYNARDFAAFFQKYTIRTVKAGVKDELTIPQQTRYAVGIELGPVQREVYNQLLAARLDELGLDARGIAASEGWQVDMLLLRTALRNLRAICTHPQVGQLQKQGDKLIKPGALKTMQTVLDDLKEKHWRSTMDDAKAKIQGLCTLAQYQQQTAEMNRYHIALKTLQMAEKEVNWLIEEMNNALKEHDARGGTFKGQSLNAALNGGPNKEGEDIPERGNNEKGKERECSPISSDGDNLGTVVDEEHAIKYRVHQQRLREVRLVLHRVKFLQGDVYHVLGDQHSASEDQAYDIAEQIRRDLLKGSEEDATRLMITLDSTKIGREGISIPNLHIEVPYLSDGCKEWESHELVDEAHRIIEDVLNAQSNLLWEWRAYIVEQLSRKLNSSDDDADGQEYQRTLDNQGQAEVYLQLYAALLADRREALLHERTLLAAHDVREKKLRQTAAAKKAAAALDALKATGESLPEIPDDLELQPEHEVEHKELSEKRKGILKQLGNKALRTVAVDLHAVAAAVKEEDDPEKLWAKDASARLRRLISDQETLQDMLDADLVTLRKVFNQRIIYYRQLQEISDSVVQVVWDGPVEEAIAKEAEKNKALDTKVALGRSKQRYLTNLARNKGGVGEDEDTCILCKCEFSRGFITQCAHIFCEGCMRAWMAKREGNTCPMCRVDISASTLQRFMVGSEPEPAPHTLKLSRDEIIPHSHRQIAYNTIDPEVFRVIQQTEALGDFGNKVQTLVKHILHLRVHDPESKSIIFSAWADSLHIVQAALSHNGIRSLRIDQNSTSENAANKFRKDPTIPVLLLHGERENAGLNLTCASRVFLLESVVHHGFELQAIARIDRLGQTRPTEVYCYYAENTVERNILDLAARQGLSLYTRGNASGTLNVSKFELGDEKRAIDLPTKKKAVQRGDFIFRVDDMLAILFPHMYEDIEYLIPESGRIVGEGPDGTNDFVRPSSSGGISAHINGAQQRIPPRQENAVAGPSRLG